jgi:hypothetical protein
MNLGHLVGKRGWHAYTGRASAFDLCCSRHRFSGGGSTLSPTTSWRFAVSRRPYYKIPDWLDNLFTQVIALIIRRYLG